MRLYVHLVLQHVVFLCLIIYLRPWDDSNQLRRGALIRIVFGLAETTLGVFRRLLEDLNMQML